MTKKIQPKELTRQTLKLYWQHAWAHKPYVIGLMVSLPITLFVSQFLPPLIIATILQRISSGNYIRNDLWHSFGPQLLIYGGLSVLGGVFLWRIVILFIWKLENDVHQDIHQRIFAHLMSLSATFHSNRFGGSLVSQTTKFVSSYTRIADTTVFQVATLLLAFVFTSIVLIPRAPVAAALLLVFSALFIWTAIRATKPIRALNAIESAKSTIQTGYLADAITNVLAIKGFAGGAHERQRYAAATGATHQAATNVMWLSTKRDFLFSTMTTILSVVALVVAVASVVLYHANVATVFLIVTYTTNIATRLWDFSQSTLRNYNRSLGDAREMTEILAIQPGVTNPEKPESSRISQGAINFKDMTFAHPESGDDQTLFQKLNLNIASGEKIGLVGHSGSGKTSLTKLLLRFSDIDSGQILIDGQNIARITQDNLRSSIAYVPQEPLLFHRSIRENIAYGRPEASSEQIEEAARKANADLFIAKLPHGYETLVGERGVKLSGGQRQRIAIARAILKDAPILVLDEATSALDSESEKLIQSALWELMKGRTAIVIAHRLSTIQKMDRIVVLENGAIIEEGSHAHLVKKRGTYAQLWAHQSGGFIEE
jgi:ATP-binding cassette subfamily B protein